MSEGFDAKLLEEMWMRDAKQDLEKRARTAERRAGNSEYGALCGRQAARWRKAAEVFRLPSASEEEGEGNG